MEYERAYGPLYKQRGNPRASRLTIPYNVGPHARLVFSEMKRQGRTYDAVEVASGVLRSTMKAWRGKNRPGLESLEAVFATLGYRFIPTPILDVLTAEVADDLNNPATKMGCELGEVWAALIDIGIEQRKRQTN